MLQLCQKYVHVIQQNALSRRARGLWGCGGMECNRQWVEGLSTWLGASSTSSSGCNDYYICDKNYIK